MNHKDIQESGLLELYAMGLLEGPEVDIVQEAIANNPLVALEFGQIEDTLFQLAQSNAAEPNPTLKSLLLGKIDYLGRLRAGEIPVKAPSLTPGSKVADFQQWLTRSDMQLKGELDLAQVAIISDEPDQMTAIVWLRLGAPAETHSHEYEKFLIVEGSCDLTIGTKVHSLKAGDFLSIPLHITHHVEVTSDVPCKIILQRAKARFGL
jgi:mannose-6-phosphate isomerase-like protein (cupin superfamily)